MARPKLENRDKVKDQRYEFKFSKEQVNAIGGRKEVFRLVKKFINDKINKQL